MSEKILSLVNFYLEKTDKPFSIDLYEKDFLFIAGETDKNKIMRGMAGFLDSSNYKTALRIHGQKPKFVFIPHNAARCFPPHRAIKDFALDIISNKEITEKILYQNAKEYEIDSSVLKYKPKSLPLYVLQDISLWLGSFRGGTTMFVEEPEEGWQEQCKPFSFLQNLIRKKQTNCIVYSAADRKSVLEKSLLLQFCNAKIAVFYNELLIEKGYATEILRNHTHPYTTDWVNLDYETRATKVLALDWLNKGANNKASKAEVFFKRYCPAGCNKKSNCNSYMWDLNANREHSIICKDFIKSRSKH